MKPVPSLPSHLIDSSAAPDAHPMEPSAASWDGSMAKVAVRLALFGLGALALLPPLLWSLAVMLLGAAHAPIGGWAGVAGVGAASFGLALALWAWLLKHPMRALMQAERRIRVLDKRDALTGLPNREGLRLALERALARWNGTRRAVGVLVIDVDRFHIVNDSLGPVLGDQLLRSVASRIRAVVRDTDVVARLGADQFAVQVEGVSGVQALNVMARNLLRALEPAHTIGGRDTVATLSIGGAVSGEPADRADALLQCAEVATRVAKTRGGARFCSFEPAMQVDEHSRVDMERRVRKALSAGEFTLAYQPIMDRCGERIAAVEALMRWNDPLHGAVSPVQFIPVLEQTGLIVEAGTWVLREACRQGLHWIVAGAPSLVLSVNVSPTQFAESRFVTTVEAVLAETGFPATRLQLEVTEGLLLEPTPETLRKIGALKDMGVRLAVDDFGMGYSSLAYLKTFPLHALKIDRMFVREMAQHDRDAAIVRAIIDLGHGLGLKITAEGVETVDQFKALQTLGCDSLQGFLFSRPIGAAEFTALLSQPGKLARNQSLPLGWSPTMAGILSAT